jgi:hypothetical protein
VEVYFLPAEPESLSVFSKRDRLQAKNPGIVFLGLFKIGYRNDNMIESNNLHDKKPFAGKQEKAETFLKASKKFDNILLTPVMFL